MTIHSPHFKSQHAFIHNKMERILRNSFLKCDDMSELMLRTDIRLKHNVYFIDNAQLKSKQMLDVYFGVDIACYNDINNQIRDKTVSILTRLGDSETNLHKITLYGIKILLGIEELRIGEEFKLEYENTIDQEYNNDILLRLSIWRGVVEDKIAPIIPTFTLSYSSEQLMNIKLPPRPETKGSPKSTVGWGEDNEDDSDDHISNATPMITGQSVGGDNITIHFH